MLWLARIKHSDEYTAEHSLRVAIFSIALGRELGLRQGELEHLGMCGMLHDVGKIKVPSAILSHMPLGREAINKAQKSTRP